VESLDRELEVARAAARAAGKLVLERYGDDDLPVRLKPDQSPVTAADEASNTLIVDRLRAAFPADAILSEESPDDPARMVGNGAVDAPNVRAVDMAPADLLVLCSDGTHRHISCDELGLLATADAPLALRCERIVDHARHAGSHDDATVLLIERRV